MATIPEFIQRDPAQLLAENKAYLEAQLNGREILPGQFEHLLLNTLTYSQVLTYNRFNAGLSQILLEFSRGVILDYLAALVAVERLPAASAGCTVRFTLVEGHGSVLIPAGTRVASSDGRAVFETTQDVTANTGVLSVDVRVMAEQPGKDYNDYPPGTVNKILDPYAFLSSAANIDTTGGGSDVESDEQLKARIKLAPAQYSTAGSVEAYLFHAKSGNTLIRDVSVTSPLPGTVLIVALSEADETAQQVIQDIYRACTDEKVRPLTDVVIVAAPVRVDYNISVNITAYESADAATVKKEIESILKAYTNANSSVLGKDIIVSHIVELCRLNSVYDVEVISPATNIIVSDEQAVNCKSIEVNITGFNRG